MSSRTTSTRRRRRQGFTLIEVLLVLAIIVIIASLAVTNIFTGYEAGRIRAARAQLQEIQTALDLYRTEWNDYPPSLEVLCQPATTRDGRALGDAWLKRFPTDPWNHPYGYQWPGQNRPGRPDIWSCGPDGISGNEDDIGNWQE
jgi:general secretion pathway protein G